MEAVEESLVRFVDPKTLAGDIVGDSHSDLLRALKPLPEHAELTMKTR
jgi:hypothetical protein